MLTLMDKAAVIRLHQQGYSNRKIAKELSIARRTVNKYVSQYKQDVDNLSKTSDPIEVSIIQDKMLSKNKMDTSKRVCRKFVGKLKDRFYEIIQINEERNLKIGPNKQEINGAVIYRQLIKEGYDIGESTIRKEYSQYLKSHQEVFIKQWYEYGDRVEFDFHVVKLIINGEVRKFHQATIACPASGFIFIRLFSSEKTISVLTGLIEFFRYAGGVPNEVTFDNLKPVVKIYGYKSTKQLTDEIIKFATYYGFNVNTCNARKGNEKGTVETGGDNARSELFSINYEFSSIEALNKYVLDSLKELNKDVLEKFESEKKCLKPLPIHDYSVGSFGIAKINTYSFALIETNYYSVPEEYVGREVRYSSINNIIVFYSGNKEICRHKKIEDTNSYSVDIHHYLKTLYKKPGAIRRSLALKQADEEIISIYQQKYIDNPKGFIDYLFDNKVYKIEESIESASSNQLKQINKTFSLGDA